MQISNQTLLFVGLGAILVWYFFLRKDKQNESSYRASCQTLCDQACGCFGCGDCWSGSCSCKKQTML